MKFNFNYDGLSLDLTIEFFDRDYELFWTDFIDLGSQLSPIRKHEEWANHKLKIVHDFVVRYCKTHIHMYVNRDEKISFSDRVYIVINDRGEQNFLKMHHCSHYDDVSICEFDLGCKVRNFINLKQHLCEKCGQFYMEGHHKFCSNF